MYLDVEVHIIEENDDSANVGYAVRRCLWFEKLYPSLPRWVGLWLLILETPGNSRLIKVCTDQADILPSSGSFD